MDEEIIPTGHMVMDNRFLEPKFLEEVTLDDCFQLQSRSDKLACVLKNQNWSFSIYAISGYPYLQVYTPDTRRSIAIECLSAPPDAFNHTQGLIELEPHVQQTFKAIYHLA
jgi:aldose 1-epimerase